MSIKDVIDTFVIVCIVHSALYLLFDENEHVLLNVII